MPSLTPSRRLPGRLALFAIWVACLASAGAHAQTLPALPGRYAIQNINSGKCVDIPAASNANGAILQQYTCNGTNAQKFDLQQPSPNRFVIANVGSGKCVDVPGFSLQDAVPLQQYTCNGSVAQQFAAEPQGNGIYRFVNVNSGKCFDVQWASLGDRAPIQQYACNGSAAQQFVLVTEASPAIPAVAVSPVPVVGYEYDAESHLTGSILAPDVVGFGFRTTNVFDTLNRLSESTDARQGLTLFGYDAMDRLASVSDPRRLSTQYPRNGLGDMTALASFDTGVESHSYDLAGNLSSRLDSRGVQAVYSYDELNRLKGLVYSRSGQTSLNYTWTYDLTGAGYGAGVGRLSATGHPAGSTQNAYNDSGQVVTDVQRIDPAAGANTAQVSLVTRYAYDAAGRVDSVTYPSGRLLRVGYLNGQLANLALAKDAGSATVPLLSRIEWEPFGSAIKGWQWNTATGRTQHMRSYDTSGRVVRYTLGGLVRDLRYDEAGRIKSYTHRGINDGSAQTGYDQSFGYDELGRVTQVTLPGTHWGIEYDPSGNRTAVTLNGVRSTYGTPINSNRLTSVSNPAGSFFHDQAGNTIQDTGKAYTATYNLAGRMDTLTRGGVTTQYSYDGLGRRIRKFGSTGLASTVLFAYGQGGQLLGEYDTTGKALREYVWLGTTPVAMFTPDPANAANPPLVYFIHADHLDTPRVVIDKTGGRRWRWLAEPFGTTAPETNPEGRGVFTQNLRFPGQYADQESGLSYNYFRTYDSLIGRYTQSDPIGLGGGINTYAYVGGDPISYTDPMGLMGGGGNHAACSCPIPPEMPGSEKSCPKKSELDKNIKDAGSMGPIDFYQAVRNKGRWDYKQQSSSYQDFGNFNFGATGYAAGLSPILLPGAGWAQSRAGTSKPEWGHWYGKSPYGDDPADQATIRAGMEYARCGCDQ